MSESNFDAEQNARFRKMMPFLFPGAIEEEEVVEPPFHPELEEFSFYELYGFIFDQMRPGEKVVDTMKRIDKSQEPIDDMAKWVSELFVRGEIEVVEIDWVMIGIRGGRIDKLQSLRWDMMENGKLAEDLSYADMAPRLKVLIAEESTVRIRGTEEWIPIEKIHFDYLV